MIRFLSSVLLVAVAAPVAADEVALPPGKIVGGFVEDDGTTVLLSTEERVDGTGASTILRIAPGAKVESFELPNIRAERLRLLEDGRLFLAGSKAGPIGRSRPAALVRKVVKLRAGEVVTLWSWEEPDCPEKYRDMHGCALKGSEPPGVSDDGKTWGGVWPAGRKGAEFTFGRTRKGSKATRTEIVEFDSPDRSESPAGAPYFFWFLDSEGQAVMVPWSMGAYIVHFSDGGSPYTVPVLQGRDSPSDEAVFRWQRGDRLLWISSGGGRWRAYHLWDLGLSGLPAEPLWEIERKDGWRPHWRGVVRVVEGALGYRIEHLWREPWTGLEEHHVSDWRIGSVPQSRWVSQNGRHAAVLETRQLEEDEGGGVAFSVRGAAMRWEPRPLPPIEAAEPPAEDGAEPARKQDPPAGR